MEKPESALNISNNACRVELEAIASGCHEVLRVLSRVLEKYNALGDQERGTKKLWRRIRFDNGEVADPSVLKEKVTYYTSTLSLYLNLLSMGSMGRVKKQMEDVGCELKELEIVVKGITTHLMTGSHTEESLLTLRTIDKKAV